MVALNVVPVGLLRQYVGGEEVLTQRDWAGRSVRELIAALGIPSEVVGAVLVNGTLVQKDHILQGEETVKLIPLIGGG